MTGPVSVIRTFPITSTDFTPIVAPINCDYYAILGTQGGGAVIRSMDPDDDQAQHVIAPGGWYALVVPKSRYSGREYRFQKSETVMYAKSTGPDDTVIVEFIC